MNAGWQTKSLGDVCKTGSGGTPLKSKKEFYDNGTIPWLMSGEVSQGEVHVATRFITQKGLENSSARIFPKNTVLVAMYGATAGQVGILKFESSTNQAVCGILPSEQFIPEFLYYLFLSKKDELISQATGNAQPNISQIKIKNTHVPIIKLSEQQRIVTILDKAFEGIATATANAKKNLANARELFESYLQSVLTNKSEDWEKRKLIEITNKIGSGATPRGGNKSYKVEGISLIRSMNVHDFEFREKKLAFIDEQQAKELNNVTLEENDVLLNITGASVARCCVVPKSYLPARVNQHVSIIRARSEIIDSIFLNLLLVSKFYKDQLLLTGGQGATRQAITKAQLEIFEVSFPKSIEAQKFLVAKFDALSDETKRLEAIYQQKLIALDELKKSILNQAFTGQLK
jgi:type I restriction enzyme, S subunit